MNDKQIYKGERYGAGELVDHFILEGYKPVVALERAKAVFAGKDECSHPRGEVDFSAGPDTIDGFCHLCGAYL